MPEEFKDQELGDKARKSEHNDRATASRINGAKSKGPKTANGKAKSSQNALKHGFRSAGAMVIDPDRQPEYDRLRDEILVEVDQNCPLQARAAELMIVNFWKFQQANELQVDLIRQACAHSESLVEACFSTSGGVNVHTRLNSLIRHEGQFDRGFHRGLKALLKLRKEQQLDRPSTRNKSIHLNAGFELEPEPPIQLPDCQLQSAHCQLQNNPNEPKPIATPLVAIRTNEPEQAASSFLKVDPVLNCSLLSANCRLGPNEPESVDHLNSNFSLLLPNPTPSPQPLSSSGNPVSDGSTGRPLSQHNSQLIRRKRTNKPEESALAATPSEQEARHQRADIDPRKPTESHNSNNAQPVITPEPPKPKPPWGADYATRCAFSGRP